MTKRVLIIADADGAWTKRFVENVLLPAGYEAVLFPIWGNQGTNDAFYRENGVAVYRDEHRLPVIRHIPRLRMWVRVWLNARKLCRQYGPFDIVHNHYLSQRDLALGGRVARRYRARWVCCFWGSDLLRSSQRELMRMKPYLERCDRIHSVYNPLVERLRQLYGDKVAAKAQVLQFGQATFDCIARIGQSNDRAACKAHFGIGADRFVLCVGYSASSAQQQLAVLEALKGMPLLSRMTIVLQQTYCQDDAAYVQRTRDFCRSLPCQTLVLTQWMNDEETAWLRLAADAFILAIRTDAFCASLREYLYAGARVMYGDWLQYPMLKELGLEVPTFHTFSQLPALVERAVNGSWPAMTPAQREAFGKLFSARERLADWLKLYEPG